MASMQKGGQHLVRPTGLTEALWACVLDDYLSEEEEGEFNKILGKPEQVPWYLKPEIVACAATPRTATPRPRNRRLRARDPRESRFVDPRDARARGGRDLDSSDEERDGTPGVWDEASGQDMPPVMWLSVPPAPEEKKEPDWDMPIDWDTPTDWDMNVKLHRMRHQKKKQQEQQAAAGDTAEDQSPNGAPMPMPLRLASKSSSRLSDLLPRALSRISSDNKSKSTKSTTSRSRGKSQQAREGRRGKTPPSKWENLLESRQAELSRRGASRPRRQSIGNPAESELTSPKKDSMKPKSGDVVLPVARTLSSKKLASKWRRTKQEQYVV